VENVNFEFLVKHQELLIRASEATVDTVMDEVSSIIFSGGSNVLKGELDLISQNLLELSKKVFNYNSISSFDGSSIEVAFEHVMFEELFNRVLKIELLGKENSMLTPAKFTEPSIG